MISIHTIRQSENVFAYVICRFPGILSTYKYIPGTSNIGTNTQKRTPVGCVCGTLWKKKKALWKSL